MPATSQTVWKVTEQDEHGRTVRISCSVAYRDPPLCPVCKTNHVGWWVTDQGQIFDPYCKACGFDPADVNPADLDPRARDRALQAAVLKMRLGR